MQVSRGPLRRSESASTTYDIPQLIQLVASGRLRIPQFQRGFVWAAEDVRTLFDSIYRGFPIGTLLLWRHKAPAGHVLLGGATYTVGEEPAALWVVDGQQRITSLVASLADTPSSDASFAVYFDLERARFIGPSRGGRPRRSIPVRSVLESRNLIKWLRDHDDELEPEDYETADQLGGALRDYRIAAYTIEGDDESVLREVFDRVNSAGKPMTRAQVFHALFAHESGPVSPSTVADSLKRLGFGSIAENRVVQSLLALRGGNIARNLREEFTSSEDPQDWYDQTEQALSRSVAFLKSEGIPHLLLMPTTFPIPVLAAFFHLHPDPDPWIMKLLSRWLWRGFVYGFGRESGQTPTLRRAAHQVNPTKNRPEDAPTDYEAVRDLISAVKDERFENPQVRNFRTNRADSVLLLLALSSLHPRDPEGVAVDISGLLETRGITGIGHYVPGHPSDGAARGFWDVRWGTPTGFERESIMATHAVTETAVIALSNSNIDEFLDTRAASITRLTTEFLNSKMAPDSLIRPPLSELVILDAEIELEP